ncbi:MAG: hypothetical protein V3W34_13010 [Phycisphaerae bacterium]
MIRWADDYCSEPRAQATGVRSDPALALGARIRLRADRRLGYILMDVVISIGLLLLGLTFIGAQVQESREAAYASEDLTRVLMLAESKLAELDTGLIHFEQEADDEVEGDFTLRFPNYGWRMRVVETATEGLRAITLEILFAPRESLEDEFDVDDAEVVHRVYTMRADPPLLDMETDLGLDEETIIALSETLPVEFFDPPYFDPSKLPQLDIEDLMELLPSLLDLFGDNADGLLAALPPEFRAMLDLSRGERGEEPEGRLTGDASLEPSDEDLELFNMTREEFQRLEENQRQTQPAGARENRRRPRPRGRPGRRGRSGTGLEGGRS